MAVGDITKSEVRPDVAGWKLDSVLFLVKTKTCKVNYEKVDASNNNVGEQRQVLLQDKTDNPDTPTDETSTEFTDLIVSINSGSNIKASITNAVKIKLGI